MRDTREFGELARDAIFTVAVAGIARGLIWRDRVLGRIQMRFAEDGAAVRVSEHWIASGENRLVARMARPEGTARANLLICHGIGETVDHWLGVQRLLAEHGVASLVFDYSGYGRSTGRVGVAACERDAVAAFEFFAGQAAGRRVSVLGFSLGSGIAAAIAGKVAVDRLILCAAYTSLRKAACSVGLPRVIAVLLPDAWRSAERLRESGVPVLIVQGEADWMFPPEMARELASEGGDRCELVVVPGLSHNGPMYRPQFAYWALIVERLDSEGFSQE